MARGPRLVVPGLPHHITQRGNRGGDVFLTDRERQRYLTWLAEASRRHCLRVWAYCLMRNHVHLVAVPEDAASLARTLRDVHTKHSQAMNAEHDWEGHLWHGRYYSCVLDDDHLAEAVRYVERNPVRAGLVAFAEAYPWSSAQPHCGLRIDAVLASDLPLLDWVEDWRSYLRSEGDPVVLDQLRVATKHGRSTSTPVRSPLRQVEG